MPFYIFVLIPKERVVALVLAVDYQSMRGSIFQRYQPLCSRH